jgi:hypothetical protein
MAVAFPKAIAAEKTGYNAKFNQMLTFFEITVSAKTNILRLNKIAATASTQKLI